VPSTGTSSPSCSRWSPTPLTPGSAAWTPTWSAPSPTPSPVDWFGQIRQLAADLGFAPNQKAYKQDPDAYPGSIREASQIIRVLLTGTPRSPDLAQVAAALGAEEVLRRIRAVL